MCAKFAMLSAALLLTATCFATPGTTAIDTERDVEQAVVHFYSSLNALFTGNLAPMEEIWSHADDVTYMGPAGGIQVGWQHVRTAWKSQAELKLGGQVEPHDIHVTVGENLAIVQCNEIGNNTNVDGQNVSVSIRATNVFRKEQGEWKMIGHHTDLIPELDKD
jgi:ketosteroid isomerase-like protein